MEIEKSKPATLHTYTQESEKGKLMAAAAFAHDLASMRGGEELAFIGLPSKRSAKQLSASADEVIRNIGGILGQMLTAAIEKRTAAEFAKFRDATFPSYAQVMLALSRLAQAIIPKDVLIRLTSESLCEMEAEFREQGLASFGTVIQDQAMFTIWTLRKIADLGQRIAASEKLDPSLKEKDVEFCGMFAYHALRTRFHLDCLSTSMRTGVPIYPEVLEQVSDALRSAVDAYGWIKQGANLRLKQAESVIEAIELDYEDQQFLSASAYDMAAEPQ